MMTNLNQAHLDIAAASHPGLVGKNNEDRYSVSAFMTGSGGKVQAVFAILCDGIGGHRAGEIAAQLGVTTVTEVITASDGLQPLETLENAIQRANHTIFEASLSVQGRRGMGTTCVCAWVIADRLYTANLGDSRIYLLREEHIMQLTTDHTWLQEAYDAGIISDAHGGEHPNAHVIRRYLGSARAPRLDFRLWFFDDESDAEAIENQGLPLEAGDTLLLCSDGLTDLVSDHEIQRLVKSAPLDRAPGALIDLANARGGHDNTTVVLLRVPGEQDQPANRSRKGRILRGCVAGLVLMGVLALAIYFGLRWRAARFDFQGSPTSVATRVLSTQQPGTPSAAETVPAVIEASPSPGQEQGPTLTPWPTHTLQNE